MFILVPALLDMKGDLEMTLNSRLSTEVNYHPIKANIYDHLRTWRAVLWSNIAVAQVQAVILGAVSAGWALVLNHYFGSHKSVDTEDIVVLFATSIVTASTSALIICWLMSMIIVLSPRYGLNPDNFANPIASTLGDFVTLLILSLSGNHFLTSFGKEHYHMILIPLVLIFCAVPFWINMALKSYSTRNVLRNGWLPILAAMVISSVAGLILESKVQLFPLIALLSPLLNGIGGSAGAVLASRSATSLHLFGKLDHPVASSAMATACLPIHALAFLVTYHFSDYTDRLLPSYFASYLLAAGLQLVFIVYGVRKTSSYIWQRGLDPDNWVIPFITAAADLSGITFIAFFISTVKI